MLQLNRVLLYIYNNNISKTKRKNKNNEKNSGNNNNIQRRDDGYGAREVKIVYLSIKKET